MIRWETCSRDFEPDGALRDIYVLGTSVEDWQVVLRGLRCAYEGEFLVDGSLRPLVSTVDEAMALRETATPLWRINADGIVVACHFFTEDEIEFDIDPQEVTCQAGLDALLLFVRRLGDLIRKPVGLCCESDESNPFISYRPESESFVYHQRSE